MKAPIFIQKILLLLYLNLFCCLNIGGIAQASKIDSLLAAVDKESDLASKIKLYFKIASRYNYTNGDSSIIFNKLALNHAIKLDSDSLIGQC